MRPQLRCTYVLNHHIICNDSVLPQLGTAMRIRERATIVTPLRAAALLYPTVLFSWSRSITPVSRHSLSHTRAESFTTHKSSHHKANLLLSHTTFIRVLTFPLTIPLCMLVIDKWMLDGNDIKEFFVCLTIRYVHMLFYSIDMHNNYPLPSHCKTLQVSYSLLQH